MKNSNPLRLYSLVAWDRSAKVRWVLKELGVEYEERTLNRDKKENESPEYLRLNPMGRIPVLEVGDKAIFESGAICAYVSDLYSYKDSKETLAPAIDSPDRGDYQKWMYFASTTLDAYQRNIMIIEDIPPGAIQKDKEQKLQTDLRDSLEALNQVLSKNNFLVGNRFTTADICVSYHLFWLTLWPELNCVIEEFPSVVAYSERMKNMPSAKKADVFSYQA